MCKYINMNQQTDAGIILCMRPANERRRYIVTSSLIGCAHTQNDPCSWYHYNKTMGIFHGKWPAFDSNWLSTLRSTLVWHWSDTKDSDRFLIDVDPMILAFYYLWYHTAIQRIPIPMRSAWQGQHQMSLYCPSRNDLCVLLGFFCPYLLTTLKD